MDQVEIKALINSEIEKTTNSINSLIDITKPISPENAIGRISRMDAINNKSVNEASLRQAKIKLKKLEEALGNIGSSDFGICVRCKKNIPIGRMMIMPHATKCVNCA